MESAPGCGIRTLARCDVERGQQIRFFPNEGCRLCSIMQEHICQDNSSTTLVDRTHLALQTSPWDMHRYFLPELESRDRELFEEHSCHSFLKGAFITGYGMFLGITKLICP